jgi:hypothetical protein
MRGFITTKDVLLHAGAILEAFGLRVYLRCIARVLCGHGKATFLECIWRDGQPDRVSAVS